MLGVEAALVRKAREIDIFQAVKDGRVAYVQLVCKYVPRQVFKRQGLGELLLHIRTLPILTLLLLHVGWSSGDTVGDTILDCVVRNNRLEIAQLLLATKAAIDVRDKVRAACKWRHAMF